ncbi:MAG: TIGR03857 family LLM class F420-dependent oxidoreductase [Caenibius sp.]
MPITPDQLYSYILPGQVNDPRPGLDQARKADTLGLGGIFLSERWETKELGATMGALTQVTDKVRLVAGLTHFGTRHPVVQAGMAQTLQQLSGNRFVLGYGRGVESHMRKMGIPTPNLAGLADYAMILRRLWAGETVEYDGPAGNWGELKLPQGYDTPPPLIFGTIGPKTLAMAGAHFDGVVLHPFLTVEGVRRSIAIVRNAAADAGKEPQSVKIYATIVTVPDTLDPDLRIDLLEARAVSYFMHPELGRPIIATNGWDSDAAAALQEKGLAKLEYGTGDAQSKRRAMAEAASLLTREWLETGAATGSLTQCADRLEEYVAAGVDHILLHGTTPDMQDGIVTEVTRRLA